MSRKRRTESKQRRPAKSAAGADAVSLPVAGAAKPRRAYARWRAMTLGLVYVLLVIHFVHWKLAGKAFAPLELNEVMQTLELIDEAPDSPPGKVSSKDLDLVE